MEWNYKDTIARRVIDYYTENPPVEEQIVHTQAVANYTRLIASGEGMERHTVCMHEISAWLHDIGCPTARRLHGSAQPVYQMKYGRTLVEEWLKDDTHFSEEEKVWLADVVGSHHVFKKAKELHFEPLFEADLIVNLWEGYYEKNHAAEYEKMVTTETGKGLFRQFFLTSRKDGE